MVNRFKLESLAGDINLFVTLTYDPINVPTIGEKYPDSPFAKIAPGLQTVCKSDLQRFFQNIRNSWRGYDKRDWKLRYAFVSEYGPKTLRPHYHGIFFNVPYGWNYALELQRLWPHGFVSVGLLTDGGSGYVGKYLFKKSEVPSTDPDYPGSNFALSSRRPPIGTCGLSKQLIEYINKNGTRRLKVKHLGQIVVPYVLLDKFLSPRQIQRLKAIEHIKAYEFNTDRRDALVARYGSSEAASRRIQILSEQKWIELNDNINRSKKQSKDL